MSNWTYLSCTNLVWTGADWALTLIVNNYQIMGMEVQENISCLYFAPKRISLGFCSAPLPKRVCHSLTKVTWTRCQYDQIIVRTSFCQSARFLFYKKLGSILSTKFS